MASEVKANKLSPSSGTDLTLGDASDTVIVPTGVTLNIVDGLGVAKGGTGLTSFTAGDVLYATGTTTLAKLAKGSAEQVLSMNSGATAPEWTTAAATAGGTGQTGFTAGDILYANSTTTLTKLGKGTARQGLQTNSGATAPEWVNSPQSLMTAEGDILYASGANTLAKLAKGSDDEVLTLASGVPSWAAAGGGAILQVKSVEYTGTASNTSTTPAVFTAFDIAFTPTAATSKLCLTLSMSVGADGQRMGGYFYDSTGAAIIGPIAAEAGSRQRLTFSSTSIAAHTMEPLCYTAWFTPGDTTTRTIQVFAAATGAEPVYINRTYTDTNNSTINNSRSASTFTITEYDGSIVTIA
jgi:hypothetical protein